MPINTKPLEMCGNYRMPNKYDKYVSPWDNLAYALLYSAMQDLKEPRRKKAAAEWLENEGREIYEYLKTRPLKPVSENTNRKRKKKRNHKSGGYKCKCTEYKYDKKRGVFI